MLDAGEHRDRNAPEISHDEEAECAPPTGKLMHKAEIDLQIAGEVAAVGACHVRAAAGCLISRFAFQTGRKDARLSCSLQFGVEESSFQAARLSSKQHRLIS